MKTFEAIALTARAMPIGSAVRFQGLIDSEKARYKKIITEKNIGATG